MAPVVALVLVACLLGACGKAGNGGGVAGGDVGESATARASDPPPASADAASADAASAADTPDDANPTRPADATPDSSRVETPTTSAIRLGLPSIPPLDPPAADTIPPFADPASVARADPAPTADAAGRPMFPLTGLPAPSATVADAPVLAVKIDNAAAARPQTGLDRADVIIEEVVEGGVTRFLALFQSQGSDPVGPIRSVRPVDPALLTPFGGGFAYSGGTKRFINNLRRAPIADVGVDLLPAAYFRGRQAKAPYNLYSTTSALRAAMGDVRGPERPWDFVTAGTKTWSAPGATAVAVYDLIVSTATRVAWRWDPAAAVWDRSTNGILHVVRGGGAVTAVNVIVIHVPYLDTTATDASHAPVPEPAVLGSGAATYLVDGMQAEGRWSKSDVGAPMRFADSGGAAIRLRRGVTWLLLAPAV